MIVDATFLKADERGGIVDMARTLGCPFDGIWLDADTETLESRIRSRHGDASDATVEIKRAQKAKDHGPIDWMHIDAAQPVDTITGTLAQRLSAGGSTSSSNKTR